MTNPIIKSVTQPKSTPANANFSSIDGTAVYKAPPNILIRRTGGGSRGGGGNDVDKVVEQTKQEVSQNNNQTPADPTKQPPKTNVYYTSNPNFQPRDPKGVVVYLDNKGKTTGYTNTGIFVPEGVAVSRLGKKDFSNIREEVGKVTREYPDVYTLNQSYDANISLANGGQGYVEPQKRTYSLVPTGATTQEIQEQPTTKVNAIKEKFAQANRWLEQRFPRGGQQLPYGFETTPEKVSGEKFSVLFANRYIANKITNQLPESFVNSTNQKISSIPFASPILKSSEEYATGIFQFSLFAPAVANTQASTNFQEPTFRTKPLSPKQPPRSSGIDVKPVQDGFVFKEKITIPRRYEYINTPLREYFKIPDTKVTYSRPRVFEQKSLNIIRFDSSENIKQPAGVELKEITRGSPTNIRYFKLEGSSQLKPITEIKATNNIEQAQLRNLFKNTNQKIKYQDTFFTKPNQETFVSNIRTIELTRARIKANNGRINVLVKNPPLGKTTSSNTIVGIQEPIIKQNGLDIYQYKFVSRDTTFPTARPRTFPKTSGLSLIPNEPLIKESSASGNTIIKLTKPNTPRTDILGKQITETIAKNIPKVNPVPKPTAKPMIDSMNTIKPVAQPSQITRTENLQEIKTRQDDEISPMLRTNEQNKMTSAYNLNSDILQDNVQKTIPKTIQRTTPETSQDLMIEQKQDLGNDSLQIQKTNLRQNQILRLKLIQRMNMSNPRFAPRTPNNPIKPSIPKKPFGFQGIKDNILSKASTIFKVFKRTRGNDIEIGESETLFGASKLLKKSLKSDLSASGFISENGERIKSSRILGSWDYEFAPSKRDEFRLVQKRGYRLGTNPEVKQIQFFKRNKAQGGKFKWF